MPVDLPAEREDSRIERARISRIADQWMIPTSKTAYMAGLESKPVIAAARGVWVIDTDGKEYLDFGSGQMAAALGHNHPRYVAAVQRNLAAISHSTKTFLNVDRLELHQRLGEILTPPL
jgi:4-aminobutyrate aminotransferase-like enzyme